MLFTYGGFRRLVKGRTDDLGEETESGIKSVIKSGLKRGTIPLISDQIREAKRMGLKMYACINAMANFDVVVRELMDEVDKPMGLATFLELAKDATMTPYV